MKLTGKSVLITGGGTGIGLALAEALRARGNDVFICGRRADVIDAALRKVDGLSGMACDVADDDALIRLLDRVTSTAGRLDVLVNNAGIQWQTDLTEGARGFAAIEHEIRINLLAPVKLTMAALPLLLQSPEGAVVNVLSLLGIMPKPNAPGYGASKAGLYNFSKSLRLRLTGTSVKVIVVIPPLVETPLTESRAYLNKMPADVFARTTLEEIEAGRLDIAIGQAKTLMRLHRIWPALAGWWTRRISVQRAASDRRQET